MTTNELPRYALICNPTAQSGRGRRAWREIQKRMDASGVSYTLLPSEFAGHAVTLAAEQTRRGTPVVVAVGGDGTINEVLQGLMQGVGVSDRRPAFGIIYTGTSPDVCRYHRIPLDLNRAIETLLAENCHPVDVGEIHFHAAPDQSSDAEFDRHGWFLCSVNLGMGASVAQGSNEGLRRRFGDTLGTMLSLIRTVVRFTPADVACSVDGKELGLTRVLNLTIGKNPHIASGIRLGIDIHPDDGSLYLLATCGFSPLGFLGQLRSLYRGTFQDHPNNYCCRLQSFRCSTFAAANAVEFDGDPHGYLPCSIRLLPRALSLIVPAPQGHDTPNGVSV
jgi:diacylglycerol kinase family enzyme